MHFEYQLIRVKEENVCDRVKFDLMPTKEMSLYNDFNYLSNFTR